MGVSIKLNILKGKKNLIFWKRERKIFLAMADNNSRITAFISYSSDEKRVGGRFKSCLTDYCGYDAFIAHDDVPGSAVWEQEIVKAVQRSDIFIPLISKSFRDSTYTDQETGIAVCLGRKIIPIKLEDLDPYGFIGKYQALQYKTFPDGRPAKDNIKELMLTIALIGLNSKPRTIFRKKALNSVVEAFCQSGSFEIANATIRMLLKCTDLSLEHLKKINQAIKNNDQIINAYDLPALKIFLKRF